MSAKSQIVKVVDRQGATLVEFTKGIPTDMSIGEFKKVLIQDCDKISKLSI